MRVPERAWAGVQEALERLSARVGTVQVLAALTVVAAVLLAVSQFVDYKCVRAGYSAYQGVTNVVAAPIIEGTRKTAGSSHLYVLLGVAALALWALASTLGGRAERGRLVVVAGALGVAVSLIIDLPKGLEAGSAAVDHADAHASLLAGFYVQVAASALLILCGALLMRFLAAGNAP
jgi:hypothetical protein